MKIEIKKFASSSRSWGSPGNNWRTSAQYNVLIDGVLRGKLWARGQQRYMDIPNWEVMTINHDGSNIRPLRSFFRTKKAAVVWIENNPDRF